MKKVKLFVIIIAACLFCIRASSQTNIIENEIDTLFIISDTLVKHRKNTVYLELGGIVFNYSLNYERTILRKTKWAINSTIGVGRGIPWNYYYLIINTAINLSFLYGDKRSKLETGIGMLTWFNAGQIRYIERWPGMGCGDGFCPPEPGFIWNALIAYRYQLKYNLLIRASFIIFYDREIDKSFHPWGGLSIGYEF